VRACVDAKIAKGEVVHVDASLIRADVSWESLAVRHVEVVSREHEAAPDEAEKVSRKSGKYKKVCTTDPAATMATSAATGGWSRPTSSMPWSTTCAA